MWKLKLNDMKRIQLTDVKVIDKQKDLTITGAKVFKLANGDYEVELPTDGEEPITITLKDLKLT